MLQPITTLDLPKIVIVELHKKGYFYVEDLLNNSGILEKINLNISEIKKKLQLSETLALDIWQNESQRDIISVCCSDIEAILENGVQCGTIIELSGAPFSGKTQICMQLCITVQLNKCYGGLNGRTIYVDTRSSISALRFKGKTISYNYNRCFLY